MKGWNPKKIVTFASHRVRVVFKDGSKDRDLGYGEFRGHISPPNKRRDHYLIKVSTTWKGFPVDEREQRDTLLHELIHLSNLSDDKSANIPERVVMKLANDLIDGFNSNPEIAFWIALGEKK